MAEGLRRWTLNQKVSACVFESRHGRFFLFIFFFMMKIMERCAAAQASAKRERRHAGMSAANVGASIFNADKRQPLTAEQ